MTTTPTPTPSLDILVINPGGKDKTYQELGRSLAAVEPPIWAGLIAGHLRARGHRVGLLDSNALGMSPKAVAAWAAEARPRLIAIVVYGHNPSASTPLMPAVAELCRALRETPFHAPVILVGGHVAALPEATLIEIPEADFVAAGEGPLTVFALAEAIGQPGFSPQSIPGLGFREAGKICLTDVPPLISDLDAGMPGLPWDLLPMDAYRAHNWHCFGGLPRAPYAALYTSLGCPFRCTFCCIQAPFRAGERVMGLPATRRSYRCWSPAAVLHEIDHLVETYKIRNFKFADELFVFDKAHVEGICRGLIERKYDLNIWAYARMEAVHRPELLDLVRAAGVRWLALGIEAADEGVRQDVGKGFGRLDVQGAVETFRQHGFHVIGNFLFGLPHDTIETMQATLDLALELKCEFANFCCTMPYPGSELYGKLIAQDPSWAGDWETYSLYSSRSRPMNTISLSSRDVLQFRDRAFHRYFTDPAWLAHIGRIFGAATVDEVKAMVGVPLHRAEQV